MKILVLGSLNIDCTYRVAEFVRPKETVTAKGYDRFCGGKGFNQAVAFARAGGEVSFAGVVGYDGGMLRQGLKDEGIYTGLLKESSGPNGHALIQVSDTGENCIIVVPGSNAEVDRAYIDEALMDFDTGDLLVLQNEVPNVDYAIERARAKDMVIAFNPSPFNEAVGCCQLANVDFLLLNEVEGFALTACSATEKILAEIRRSLPEIAVVLTLGPLGACFLSADGEETYCEAVPCEEVDTTAAGDTFTGYFLTEYLRTGDAAASLRMAATASAIAVSRKGAALSIPTRDEVLALIKK